MGLAIEGREMELLSFLVFLAVNRIKDDHLVEESVGDEVVGDRLYSDGPTINFLSWNVRGHNCPIKQRVAKWDLCRFSCDVAILQESKMEVESSYCY